MTVMVTPAVCPRLFEFLTTLTFGAQRDITLCQQHLRPSPKQKEQGKARFPHTINKKKHELSRTQPNLGGKCSSVGVDALGVV